MALEMEKTPRKPHLRVLSSSMDFKDSCHDCVFFMAIQNSSDSVLITDPEGTILYVNDKFTEVTGYTNEDIAGKKPSILKSGETPQEEYDHLWKTIKMGIEWRGELHNKKKNGELYWEHGSIIPLRNASGAVTHFVAIKQDISENRKMDDELDRLMTQMDRLMAELDSKNRELTAKNEELDNFAHTIAHDLKSPMATFGSYLLLLNKKLQSREISDSEKNYLQGMEKSLDRMSRMISALLSYSSVGRALENVETLDFNKLVEDTLFVLETAISARGATVKFEKADIKLMGDESLLEQVFQNLIGNAIKYIGDDNPDPQVEIGATVEQGRNVFYVRDNGMGIKESYFNKLFDLFVRLPETRHIDGTGIGLATVKRILQSHNGRIWVESEPGKGTVFYFTINEPETAPADPAAGGSNAAF